MLNQVSVPGKKLRIVPNLIQSPHCSSSNVEFSCQQAFDLPAEQDQMCARLGVRLISAGFATAHLQ